MKILEQILEEVGVDVVAAISNLRGELVEVNDTGAILLPEEIRKDYEERLAFLEYFGQGELLKSISDHDVDFHEESQVPVDESRKISLEVLHDLPFDFDRLADNTYNLYHSCGTIYSEYATRTRGGATRKHQFNIGRYELEDFALDLAKFGLNFRKDARLYSMFFASLDLEGDPISQEEADLVATYAQEYADLDRGFAVTAPTYLHIAALATDNVKRSLKMLNQALHYNRQKNPNNPSFLLEEGETYFHMAEKIPARDDLDAVHNPRSFKNKVSLYQKSISALQKAEEMQYSPLCHFKETERKVLYQGLSRAHLAISHMFKGAEKTMHLDEALRWTGDSTTFSEDEDDLLNRGLIYHEMYELEGFESSRKQLLGEKSSDDLCKYIDISNSRDPDLLDIIDKVNKETGLDGGDENY